jgi:hypothetical protein
MKALRLVWLWLISSEYRLMRRAYRSLRDEPQK